MLSFLFFVHTFPSCLTWCGEHQAITQLLFSTYYCFCFTDKDTDPQSKVSIALQPDLNLGRHKCKALLLLQHGSPVVPTDWVFYGVPYRLVIPRPYPEWGNVFLLLDFLYWNHNLWFSLGWKIRSFTSNCHKDVSLWVHSEFGIQRTNYSLLSFENIKHWK